MQPDVHEWSVQIESALEQYLPLATTPGAEELNAAVRHAVFSGGKRMRPVLALAASTLVGGDVMQALRIGAAMEYLHTASLILDDLPGMDDSPERRGRPSTHVQFNEGVAVLAAMALLNHTYALLAECANGRRLIRLACECIGHRGMVAGQTIDLMQPPNERIEIRHEHYLKTTALFRLAMLAPALASDCAEEEREALAEFGLCAGMAYQLIDDAHDLDADTRRAGDWDGLTPARLRENASRWVDRAKGVLHARFGDHPQARLLSQFADWLVAGAQTAKAARQEIA
ncbi:MAG: polyprenyl synthetase family protein [Planctomycetes bacterium]|nr:polyprenyl synthetase family protein [Planctomycetota bacterium]